jgi:hypothetical protein
VTPTIADRLIANLPCLIERQRAALEAVDGLSSVQIIIQVDRYGPGSDRIDMRLEAAPPHRFRANGKGAARLTTNEE